ncbi:MAG: hypothetical protein ACJAXJ_003551 [Colwellia sp.]|jgi:hypothetical protein
MKAKTDQLLPIISISDKALSLSVAEIVIFNNGAKHIIEKLLSINESIKIWGEKLTECFSENISNFH